uniref:lysis system i-spanin subunit Rz n=1 Tax=Escherichia coli TaxID=562 RepID=UPI003313B403
MTAKVKREIKRWPKSENEALRDDVAAGRRRLHIRSTCLSRVKPPPPRAWIMQPPDWQTSLNRIISSLRERLITMQKQL